MSRFLFTAENEYLPLRRPLHVGGERIDERAVVYLGATGLDDPKHPLRIGEAAPLPGLHPESIDDVLDAFEIAQDAVFTTTLAACAQTTTVASLRFALESIWLGWRAHQSDTVPTRALRINGRDHVDVCALVEAQRDMQVPSAAKGVKVKIGRRAASEERDALRALIEELDEGVELRLDANRAWSLDEAVERLHGLPAERIAFVEEPLRDPRELPAFHARTGLHVALDESLYEPDCGMDGTEAAVVAYVVKPSLLGIQATMDLDMAALSRGKRVIVSSCFESGVGLSMLAQIAAATVTDGGPAGLGTAAWFDPLPTIAGYDHEQLRFTVEDWASA